MIRALLDYLLLNISEGGVVLYCYDKFYKIGLVFL